MILPGFRSRWTMPARWALSSADAISIGSRSACSSGSAPFARRSASVSPSRYSMTRNAVPCCSPTSYRVQMCGCVELRDRARLAVEALAELRVGRERLGEDLDGDRAIEARVARLVDLAHAAGPEGGEDSGTGRDERRAVAATVELLRLYPSDFGHLREFASAGCRISNDQSGRFNRSMQRFPLV